VKREQDFGFIQSLPSFNTPEGWPTRTPPIENTTPASWPVRAPLIENTSVMDTPMYAATENTVYNKELSADASFMEDMVDKEIPHDSTEVE